MPRIIGVTGGIACGKTTVADYLSQHYAIPVFDADRYAQEAVQPGSPILDRIVDRYGADFCLDTGHLDRRRLGDLVFSNPLERQWLEQQIHPYVRDRLQEALDRSIQAHQDPIVLVIPLLFEAQMTDLVTEIWVVACAVPQQIQRLQARNQLSLAQAQARIQSQLSLEEKIRQADVVLDNQGTRAALLTQVDRALRGQSPTTRLEFPADNG